MRTSVAISMSSLSGNPRQPIGDRLRSHRVDVLKKGLREMAKRLDVSAPHLTDIEYGRRTPSEELLVRISKVYGIDVAELRSGFGRPDGDVAGLASGSPTAAAKAPVFLRTAKDLSPEAWDQLIKQAEKLAKNSERGGKA